MDITDPHNMPDDLNATRLESKSEWLYTKDNVTYGPVTSIDLRAAAHLGFFGPDDLVRRSNQSTWMPARSIKGLFKETA